ncbi:MAG: dipeptidase [Deltaproteobacteria bacterium]|jgi:membrane dipeptidase
MIPIIDGHLDSLQSVYLPIGNSRSLMEASRQGHFDLVRARKGNFAGGLFSIFVPSTMDFNYDRKVFPSKQDAGLMPISREYARNIAQKGIQSLYRLAEKSSGRLRVSTTLKNVIANMNDNVISAILHFEGAEPIAADMTDLADYYNAGVRSIGLVWSRANAFGYGVDFQFPGTPNTGPGLTDAGKELVKACNQLGIIVDLSHLNEKGFWDVQKLSDGPLVATHSCMHALTPISRNLTDLQLDAIRDSEGIVGINFCTGFLRKDAELTSDTPIEVIVKHITYAIERMGVDHVGIGSDFDGTTIPDGIGDVSGLPNLIKELFNNGFDETTVRKIAFENWLRIFSATWKPE